jgi:hypothetical protein
MDGIWLCELVRLLGTSMAPGRKSALTGRCMRHRSSSATFCVLEPSIRLEREVLKGAKSNLMADTGRGRLTGTTFSTRRQHGRFDCAPTP